jgi:O-antigen ligase
VKLPRVAPASAATVVFGGLTVGGLAIADGGFFPSSWRWATIGLAATVAIVVLLRDRIVLGKGDFALLVGLAAITVWTAMSAGWADDPSQALLEAERTLVYVTGVLAAVLLVERRDVSYLLAGVVVAAATVSIYSIARCAAAEDPLQGPIGYANALGILAVIGILIAVGSALRTRRGLLATFAVAATVPLASALALSDSRGSVVALAVGLAVMAALAPGRPRLVLGTTVATVAAAAIAVVAWGGSGVRFAGGDRPDYWRVAWAQFEENALLGGGAGAFHEYWLEHRPDPAELDTPHVLDAHSLYLETLAELGLVGLALLVATLLIPLFVVARGRHDRFAAAAIPAYVAFLVHAGLDWDWEMPAVTLAGLLCGVAVLRSGGDDPPVPVSARTRGFFFALALGLLVLAFARLI